MQFTTHSGCCLSRLATQNLFGPLVQAFARQFCRERGLTVNFGGDPKHDLTRECFLRFLADFLTSFDVVFDCLLKGVPQRLDCLLKGVPQRLDCIRMKADTIADSGETPREGAIFIIVLDAGLVAFVCHGIGHGVTPIRSKNARAAHS